jgi:hypothetical protein
VGPIFAHEPLVDNDCRTLHDATCEIKEGCRLIFIAGLVVANLPSRQVVPRGAVKAGIAGRFHLGAFPKWRLFLHQIRPRYRGKRRSRAWRGLWWWVRRAPEVRQPPLSTKLKLEPSHPDQASWHQCFGDAFKLKATQRLIAGSYTTLFLYLSYSRVFLLYPLHDSLREFA